MNNPVEIGILFVCTQNVFRSMSAHYLALKYIKDNKNTKNFLQEYNFTIDSCGTIAYDWETPYRHTLKILSQKEVDVIDHKNKKINKNLVDNCNVIICMTREHKKSIEDNFSFNIKNKKLYLFNELAIDKMTDLEDDNESNFTCSLNQFIEKTVNHIDKYIPNIFNNIHNRLNEDL